MRRKVPLKVKADAMHRIILVLILALTACTAPAPEGPAENAPPPCEARDLEELCQGCTIFVFTDDEGRIRESVSEYEKQVMGERVWTMAGDILLAIDGERTLACWPGARAAFTYDDDTQEMRCWTRDGDEYPCTMAPAEWMAIQEIEQAWPGTLTETVADDE